MDFVLTCGTSQTEKLSKFKNVLGLDLESIGYPELQNHFSSEPDPSLDEGFLNDSETPIEEISKSIKNYINNPENKQTIIDLEKPEENNPLGAELSTLYHYFLENDISPENHRFHILRSDTYEGWFNALVLSKVIIKTEWGTVGNNTEPHNVVGLRENPNQTEKPLLNLVCVLNTILYILIEKDKKQVPVQVPVLVMSGGFKSTIPCLTVYSLVFALQLVYLFEKSAKLNYLQPVVNLENIEKYQIFWKQLLEMKTVNHMEWFHEILKFKDQVAIPWISG